MGVQHTFGGVSRVAFPLIAGFGMDVFGMDLFGMGIPYVFAGVMVIATLGLTTAMESYVYPSGETAKVVV